MLTQIRVYNGGGVLGNNLGCYKGGNNFGDRYNDPSYGVGGFLSGMVFTFSDGTKQSVGTVDDSNGAVSSAYDFEVRLDHVDTYHAGSYTQTLRTMHH